MYMYQLCSLLYTTVEETTPPTTSTPTPTNESSTTDLTAIIVGTLVGIVAFFVLIVMLTVIAACVRVRRNRADIEQLTKKPVHDRTATNPNYTGGEIKLVLACMVFIIQDYGYDQILMLVVRPGAYSNLSHTLRSI